LGLQLRRLLRLQVLLQRCGHSRWLRTTCVCWRLRGCCWLHHMLQTRTSERRWATDAEPDGCICLETVAGLVGWFWWLVKHQAPSFSVRDLQSRHLLPDVLGLCCVFVQ
jgi:hypothetical protein